MKMAQFKNLVLVAIAFFLTASLHIGETHATPKEQDDAELAVSRVQRAGFKCEGKYDFYRRGQFDSIVCSGKQYNIRVEGNDLVVWSEPTLFSNSVTKNIPLENDLREKRDRENSEKFAALNDYETKQRKEASRIIPFEQSAVVAMPSWDNQIDVVRTVAAVASYQVRCNSIALITYNGPGSAKVICDHGSHIYRIDFVQDRAYVYITYSRD